MHTVSDSVNKQAIAAAFSRAAHTYDGAAAFQRRCGERLLTYLPVLQQSGSHAVDVGCGTGYFSRQLRALGYAVTALDLAPGMLFQAQALQSADDYLLADMEHLPLPDASIDLCFSNLAIQWCSSLSIVLAELYRVLRPRGRLLFTTLAQGSLKELAQAWQCIDGQSHVNPFLSQADIAQVCAPYPHQLIPFQESENYPDIMAVMRALKAIGATHLHQGRGQGLTSKGQIQRLAEAYPRQQHAFSLSYQVVIGVIEKR